MISTDRDVTRRVTSEDGTVIAYQRTGSGPPLIPVEAAGHYRAFSSFTGLVGLLADRFTVVHYDRRGRGDSTDTVPYAVSREVEDRCADRADRRIRLPLRVLFGRAARAPGRGCRSGDPSDSPPGSSRCCPPGTGPPPWTTT